MFVWEKWKEVPKGAKGGFWKGKVLTEADINFSNKVYKICDVYTVFESIVKAGAVVIAMVVAVKATPIVLANVEALEYYCKTYGVRDGIDMYSCMGTKYLPDGVITVLQMDLSDGDSDVLNTMVYADDVVYTEEDLWTKPAVKRGKEIDVMLGNNLGDNFPIADRLGNGKLISIKSVDLGAKTYQEQDKLYGKLVQDVRKLEGFTRRTWAKKEINIDDYNVKVLRVAIPRITMTEEQKLALDAAKVYAEEKGIEVVVLVITKK